MREVFGHRNISSAGERLGLFVDKGPFPNKGEHLVTHIHVERDGQSQYVYMNDRLTRELRDALNEILGEASDGQGELVVEWEVAEREIESARDAGWDEGWDSGYDSGKQAAQVEILVALGLVDV